MESADDSDDSNELDMEGFDDSDEPDWELIELEEPGEHDALPHIRIDDPARAEPPVGDIGEAGAQP